MVCVSVYVFVCVCVCMVSPIPYKPEVMLLLITDISSSSLRAFYAAIDTHHSKVPNIVDKPLVLVSTESYHSEIGRASCRERVCLYV